VNTPNGSRLSRDAYFIAMAKLAAQRATCLRRAVGCVLVNAENHVLSTGYNGVCSGQPHCNEVTEEVRNPALCNLHGTWRKPEHWELATLPVYGNACEGANSPSGTNLSGCQAIHAEQNALLQCRNITEIHTAYVTASPCITCMRLLANTSVKRIVFAEEYPHGESRSVAERRGISWEHYRSD